jgi:hypothetical protein
VPNSILFDVIKIDSFTVKRQIKKLIYKLDFLKDMEMYFFFSVIYFEAVENDFYDRSNPSSAFVIIDKKQTYLIDRILRKEKRRERDNSTRK